MVSIRQSFIQARGGATAMIYAVAAIPIFAGVGSALDFSRTISAEQILQSAIDSAVLASTLDIENESLSTAEIAERARDYFWSDMESAHADFQCAEPDVVVDRTNYRIEISADCEVPTTVSAIIGLESFQVSTTARAQVNLTYLDLALMLDVSGSMAGAKLDALKASASSAVDELITAKTGNRVRIALAPYSTAINIGSYAASATDIAVPLNTCASERHGSHAFDDDLPGPGRWIGAAAPTCPVSEIVPLTTDRALLHNAIDSFVADGATAGHLGIAWSWYAISPEWRSFWPAASQPLNAPARNVVKAVILMTDGEFNRTYEGSGTSSEQAVDLCEAMKDESVKVFTVAFQTPPEAEATMLACATEPDMYFNADNTAQLASAYQSIASKLSELRLTD